MWESKSLLEDESLTECKVSLDSDEHRIIEQYLMLCARTSRVRILHAWHVGASRYGQLYQHHRGSGKHRLLCWVDENKLDKNNALQDVIRRGFVIPTEGMTFSFGTLILPGLPLLLSHDDVNQMKDVFPVGERRLFQLILCEVGKYFESHT